MPYFIVSGVWLRRFVGAESSCRTPASVKLAAKLVTVQRRIIAR